METTQKYLGQDIIPAIKAKVNAKQDQLIGSGEGQNIKTINGNSILGSGDIEIVDKLYTDYGTNTDGALDQNFASTKLQALEGYAAKTVQTDTKIGTDLTSTVTLVKTTGTLDSDTTTDTDIALPVASETQAGVINPATYGSIQDSAEKIELLLNASVAVNDLAAAPSQDDLTAAWKTATGKDELINGAKILDVTNNKTWTYYSNDTTWVSVDNNNPTIELKNFTNEAAGQIKGDNTTDGKVQAEADGTGSVKGWDTVKTDISNNASAITTLQTSVSDLETAVDGKQDTLVGTGEGQNIKSINGESLLGTGDIELDIPEALTVAEFNSLWDAANTETAD